jgi:hypothetical protein
MLSTSIGINVGWRRRSTSGMSAEEFEIWEATQRGNVAGLSGRHRETASGECA